MCPVGSRTDHTVSKGSRTDHTVSKGSRTDHIMCPRGLGLTT